MHLWPSSTGAPETTAKVQYIMRALCCVTGIPAADSFASGRHTLAIDHISHGDGVTYSNTIRAILNGVVRMATECPYWDVSYLVAVFFSIGCVLFIVCGLFGWLPLVAPSSEFSGETTAGGILAFIGATLFQIGAALLVWEACNENQTGCFGWAINEVFDEVEADAGTTRRDRKLQVHADFGKCQHHHRRGQRKALKQPRAGRRWVWWPSWSDIKTHYIHEIGWVASMSLVIGATIFYISGICSLPGIFDNMSIGVARGIYWFTYLLGGVIFIFSSILYMLENQPTWYTPAFHLLGWHIGVWNLIGSVGFTLSASLGYCTSNGCAYQSELALTWGSAAYLIGSMLLWYESLDKYPMEKRGKPS